MKKIFILLVLLLFVLTNDSVFAKEPTQISFIYINGSNNLTYKNRDKFRVAFIRDVNKLHPEIKSRFEKDKIISEVFLENGKYSINPEPITFYWGARSMENIKTLEADLHSASKYSPKIAHQARSLFAHCLHDAVWVQKNHNMMSVIDDLHEVICKELAKGNKVVLLGYSAGSFVTYQYYLNKANFIHPAEFIIGRYGTEINNFVANTPVKPTCFDALIDANLIKYNSVTNKYEINNNYEAFKQNYSNLDKYTDLACFTGDAVRGIVGFASPMRLFYSDFTDTKTTLGNISGYMAKSLVENDVFYLTVNYSNDPFGFSNAENYTLKGLKTIIPAFSDLKGGKGFVYNKSNNYVPRTFVTAHLAYWQTPVRFAKAIVKAYNEGYKNFYDIK